MDSRRAKTGYVAIRAETAALAVHSPSCSRFRAEVDESVDDESNRDTRPAIAP